MAAIVAMALLAAGCQRAARPATMGVVQQDRSGNVDTNRIEPDPSARMQLASNQIFILGGNANPHTLPAYPRELLALRLPDQSVCVSFVDNADGSVSRIAPLYGVPDCPKGASDTRAEFLAAAIEAVSHWDYFSSIRCTFPPGTVDKRHCHQSEMELMPVTLSYRFRFSSTGGVGTVQQADLAH